MLTTGLAALLTTLLEAYLGGTVQVPFLAAVIVTALYAGWGPGVFATLISAVAIDFYFMSPIHSLVLTDLSNAVRLQVFLLLSLPLAWLSASLRSANQRLLAARDESKQAIARAECETARAKEANRFLDSILENIPDMIFVKDAATHQFVRFNRAGEKLLGWRREDLIGKNDDDFFPPEEARAFHEKDALVLKNRLLVDIPEERIKTRYGDRILHTKKVPILDEAGKPLFLLGISEDISYLKSTQKRLSRIERRNQLILGSVGEGIYGLDSLGNVTFLNSAAARLLGWDEQELMGKPMHALLHHSRPDGSPYPKEECPIYAAFRDGAVHRVDNEVFWRKDGSSFPVEYVSSPIFEGERLVGAVVSFRDVSEFRRAIQGRDMMLGTVAHDLRNPLHTAQLAASNILRKLPTDGSMAVVRQAAESIRRSIDRADRLINDLLDVAQIEGGQLSVNRSRSAPGELIISAAETLAPTAASLSLTLETDVADDLPPVLVDPDRMFQILSNLVGNALKFTPPGGEIRLGASFVAGEVRLWVKDSGPGISAEHLPHVFDRFWQAKRTDRRGAGLGLSIAKGITEAHGGHIWVESSPGRGTTFFFTVPLAQVLEAPQDVVPRASAS